MDIKRSQPYITEDERKLTETDLSLVTRVLARDKREAYFSFLSNRVVPEG